MSILKRQTIREPDVSIKVLNVTTIKEKGGAQGKKIKIKETAYNPGILQGNHVVDVDITGLCPLAIVVRALPCSGRGDTRIVDLDIDAVTLQHELASRQNRVSSMTQPTKVFYKKTAGIHTECCTCQRRAPSGGRDHGCSQGGCWPRRR